VKPEGGEAFEELSLVKFAFKDRVKHVVWCLGDTYE